MKSNLSIVNTVSWLSVYFSKFSFDPLNRHIHFSIYDLADGQTYAWLENWSKRVVQKIWRFAPRTLDINFKIFDSTGETVESRQFLQVFLIDWLIGYDYSNNDIAVHKCSCIYREAFKNI